MGKNDFFMMNKMVCPYIDEMCADFAEQML